MAAAALQRHDDDPVGHKLLENYLHVVAVGLLGMGC